MLSQEKQLWALKNRIMCDKACNIKQSMHSPERGKGDGLWPFVSPFSLLLSEEEELGLDEEALLENGLVLQSEKKMHKNLSLSNQTDSVTVLRIIYGWEGCRIYPDQCIFSLIGTGLK